MTLVTALVARDSIVLAGDSRGSFGDPRGFMAVSDMRKKIFPLSQYCGIGISGPPDLASALLKDLDKEMAAQSAVYIDEVLGQARERLRSRYNESFRAFPIERRPVIAFIIAGYEKDFKPRVYTISSEFDYAPMLSDPGFSILGLPLFPTYLVNRFYSPKASAEQIAALAEFITFETATQDPKVGGPITLALIVPHHGYQELDEDSVGAIHRRNEEQLLRLRRYFTTGLD